MTNLNELSTTELRRLIAIKEEIEALQGQIDSIAGGGGIPALSRGQAPKRRGMSAAGRARIAAAQRARWAKIKRSAKSNSKKVRTKGRRFSPAVRAKMAAAARARWAKAKAAGKKSL